MTGINHPALLVASHIKPWKACTNSERLDENNGILLSALIDRLFDSGLVTFTKDGTIHFTTEISPSDQAQCLPEHSTKIQLNANSNRYLTYHREIVFRR